MIKDTALQKNCPVCEEQTNHSLILSGKPGYGDIYRCSRCQLTRLLPLPELSQHQSITTGMYQQLTEEFSSWKYHLAQHSVRGYLAQFRKLRNAEPNSLIDLAGGLGYYAFAFAEQGIDVTYVDIDTVSIDFVRKHFQDKIHTFNIPLEDFCQDNLRQYDIIFFRHAIEHCIYPDQALHFMRNIAHPNTILILETDNNLGLELFFHPEASRYWREVYKNHYSEASLLKLCKLRPLAIDWIETHYYAFRPDNLSRLLHQTGWQILELSLYSLGDSIYWPNVPSVGSYKWQRLRRNLREWFREVVYCLGSPLLTRYGFVSGIVVYAQIH